MLWTSPVPARLQDDARAVGSQQDCAPEDAAAPLACPCAREHVPCAEGALDLAAPVPRLDLQYGHSVPPVSVSTKADPGSSSPAKGTRASRRRGLR